MLAFDQYRNIDLLQIPRVREDLQRNSQNELSFNNAAAPHHAKYASVAKKGSSDVVC